MVNKKIENHAKSSNIVQSNKVVLLTLCIGLTITAFLYFIVHELEDRKIKAIFDEHAINLSSVIQREVYDSVLVLDAVRSFFDASTSVERDEFNRFTQPFFNRLRGIQALSWIPRVTKGSRGKYEAGAISDRAVQC